MVLRVLALDDCRHFRFVRRYFGLRLGRAAGPVLVPLDALCCYQRLTSAEISPLMLWAVRWDLPSSFRLLRRHSDWYETLVLILTAYAQQTGHGHLLCKLDLSCFAQHDLDTGSALSQASSVRT